MKRAGEEDQNGAANGQPSSGSNKKAKTENYESDDDDLPLYAPSKLSSQKRLGRECPYLDTVSRQVQRSKRRDSIVLCTDITSHSLEVVWDVVNGRFFY